MKSKLFMAAVAMALPVAARAGDTGPELAFRTGFSFPFGHFTGAPPGSSPVAVSDLFHGFVPLGVEAGLRFTPDVYAGLVFQYAIGLWNGCPSNMSCSGHDVGLGFDVRYHPLPGRQVDSWFGIGAGYEWISFAQSQPGFSSDTGLNGFELLHLDVGADLGSRTSRCTNSSPWGSDSASSRSALQLHPRGAKGRAADPSLRGRRDGHRRHLDTARGTKGSTTHGKRWTTPYSCGTTSLKGSSQRLKTRVNLA